MSILDHILNNPDLKAEYDAHIIKVKELQLRIDNASEIAATINECTMYDLSTGKSCMIISTVEYGIKYAKKIKYIVHGVKYTSSVDVVNALDLASDSVVSYRTNSPKAKYADWIALDWRL